MPVFSKYSDREYEALAKKLKAAEQSLSSLQDERDALKIDLQSATDSFSAERTSLKDQLQTLQKAQAEHKEENDLLLAQLHQVQEELEKYFLDNKSQLERVTLLEKDLAAQKDAAAKTAGELKKAQEQVTNSAKQVSDAQAAAAKQVSEVQAVATKQSEELRAKLTETEKKLSEANKLIKAEGDARVNELQKQKGELEKKLADAQAAATKLQAETDSRVNALQASEADLKSENDLLLAQLHQVQEELEKYYLGNKDLESAVTQASELIRRTRYALVDHLVLQGAPVSTPKAPHRARKK